MIREEEVMEQIRQGDVLLVRIERSVDEFLRDGHMRTLASEAIRGRIVLAEGEATGHAHVIESEDVALISAREAEELYLLVYGDAPVALTHEEHDTLDILPGVYRVVRQREYREPRFREDDFDWDLVQD
jgi:hypothetical protein